MAEQRDEVLYSLCCMEIPRIDFSGLLRDGIIMSSHYVRERAKYWSEATERLKKYVVPKILYSEVANSDLESLLRPALTFRSRVAAARKDDNYADHCGLGSSKGGNVGCSWKEYRDSVWDNVALFSLWKRVKDCMSSWMKLPKPKLEVTERSPHAGSESNTCDIQVEIPNSVYTAVSYSVKEDKLQVTARNLSSGEWENFSILCLQDPDTNLFKEYSIAGDIGLMVANDSKSPDNAHLVVFNLSTGERKELPPLQYSRNPVVLHIKVDAATGDYKVIAAGSSSMASPFSQKVEVYHSRTSKWSSAADVPGPEFGLNEHQAGVCVGGILYFIAFLAGDGGKGIVAFDMEKCEWVEEKSFPVPFAPESNILQLVECDGKLFLFSEQECENTVIHCIDQVGVRELTSVVKVKKTGGRGLLVYPEFTCVPFGAGKLCIFNTLKRSGEVYDVGTGEKCDDLEAPENEIAAGDNFFTLNPVSFALHPNLAIKP